MKSFKSFLVTLSISFLLLPLISTSPAFAILGDVNGDGNVTVGDVVFLVNYLFKGGVPPVVRNDADVDNCPGITIGDAVQISCYLFQGRQLFPPVGTDLIIPSQIKITTGWLTGTAVGQNITLEVKLNSVNQPAVEYLVLPFSYQDLPGQTVLNCTGVDFTGTLMPNGDFGIDPINEKVLIYNTTGSIPAGSNGVIAKINFTVVTPGNPTEIVATYYPPENTPLLVSSQCYVAGDPPGRMLLPKYFLNYVGEVNCDGRVTVSDVVYLVRYLFQGGPVPCDP
jgi:hypothetical protein